MRRFTFFICFLALSTPLVAQDVFLSGGNVVDVQTGDVQSASVLVRNGLIVAVSPALTPPPGVQVVDARGRWLIPGLVEMHSHTTDPATLQRALALGVTSTLTVYTGNEFIPPPWEGPSHVPGNPVPRMYLVGGRFRVDDPNPARAQSPGRFLAPTTPEEAAEYLDTYREQGVPRIKIWIDDGSVQLDTTVATFDDATLGALVEGAYARGMDVYIHALTGELYRRALASRPTWIIHPMVTDELTASDVAALRDANLGWTTVMSIVLWRGDPRVYARMALADDRLVRAQSAETRATFRSLAELDENPGAASRPRMVERFEGYLATIRRNTRLVLENGLTVAVGSDIGAGVGTHLEIELLREAGLDAATILHAATLGGARALGVSGRFGTVEAGKVADLVVLSSNPLEEITNLREVELVLKGGRVWEPAELLSQ